MSIFGLLTPRASGWEDKYNTINLIDIFQKDGDVWGTDGKNFYKLELQAISSTVNASASVLKVLLALGEGKFSEISTEDIRINDQPISAFSKRPSVQTRLGTKDQKPIEDLLINDRELNIKTTIRKDPDHTQIRLGESAPVTSADFIFTFSGLYAVDASNGNRVAMAVSFKLTYQQLLKIDDNTYVPMSDTANYSETVTVTKAEANSFDYVHTANFTSWFPEGQKGGYYDVKIERVSNYDATNTVSTIGLDRIVEYIYVENPQKISYSDTGLLFIQAEAQAKLEGSSIPQISVRTKGAEVEIIDSLLENSTFGMTKFLNGNPVPVDVLNYEDDVRMIEFLKTVRLMYPDGYQTIGEQANIIVRNISTGEITTIREISPDGTVYLRSHIFKSEIGEERFVIVLKGHSTNLIDQYHDLLKNPDYGVGRSFASEMTNYSNLLEISKYCNEMVPIDGNHYLMEGELAPVLGSYSQTDRILNTTVKMDSVNFSNGAPLRDFYKEFMEYMFPGYANWVYSSRYNSGSSTIPELNPSPETTTTMFDFVPVKLYEEEYVLNDLEMKTGQNDVIFQFKVPTTINQYVEYDTSVSPIYGTDLTGNNYLCRMGYPRLNRSEWNFAEVKNTPPMVYEITFYGLHGKTGYHKIQSFMFNHRYAPVYISVDVQPTYGSQLNNAVIVSEQQIDFRIDISGFFDDLLIAYTDGDIIDNFHVKVVVRAIPHLFYYSTNYTDAVVPIVDLETELGTDLATNKTIYDGLISADPYDPTFNGYNLVSYMVNFCAHLYSEFDQTFSKVQAIVPGITKTNFHGMFVNPAHIPGGLELQTYQEKSVGWISSLFLTFYEYRKSFPLAELIQGSSVIQLGNYKKSDENGDLVVETNVDVSKVVLAEQVTFQSGDYNPIYRQITSTNMQISPGAIIYNLDTYERAEVESFIYQNDISGELQLDPTGATLVPSYLKLSKPIFNSTGLTDLGEVARYRIFSLQQCEPRHISSFVVSDFYNPKSYLPTLLASINAIMVPNGHLFEIIVEGLTRTSAKEEIVISESDVVPGSLSVHSKSKRSIPNTVEIQFMNAKNRNQKQLITVRDKNALQGVNEAGETISRPQPERKTQAFYPNIGRVSEALRKANYTLNHDKLVRHVISFNTFGRGGSLKTGDTFRFRVPIMRQGISGSIINAVVNGDLNSRGDEELVLTLATPVADLIDGVIFADSSLSGQSTYKYVRGLVGNPYKDLDFWCFINTSDDLMGKFKIQEIDGYTIKIVKTDTVTEWIDLKHDDFNTVTSGMRIAIGEKEEIATRYRVAKIQKNVQTGIIQIEAHPYYPQVYSDIASFGVIDSLEQGETKQVRSISSPPRSIQALYLLSNKVVLGLDGNKTYNMKFRFPDPNDPFFASCDVFWKWSDEPDEPAQEGLTDRWKKLAGGSVTSDFEITNLVKKSDDVFIEIILQPISKYGVRLEWKICKEYSKFAIFAKEENEIVPFPENFKATLDKKNLRINFNWSANPGLSEYLIHTKYIDGSLLEHGGDFGWGFDYSQTEEIATGLKLASNRISANYYTFDVPRAGTYQFMIRGLSTLGHLSGEVDEFSVANIVTKGVVDFVNDDLSLIDPQNIYYVNNTRSDDLNFLVQMATGELGVTGKAILLFTPKDFPNLFKSGIHLRKLDKSDIGTNRWYLNDADYSFLINEGLTTLIQIVDGYTWNDLFWLDEAYQTFTITGAGVGYIELDSDPFSSDDLEISIKTFALDITRTSVTESEAVIITNETENWVLGTEYKPARIQDVIFNLIGDTTQIASMIKDIFYSGVEILGNSSINKLSKYNPMSYSTITSFRCTKNLCGDNSNYCATNFSKIEITSGIKSVSGQHIIKKSTETVYISDRSVNTAVAWKVFDPCTVNNGIALVDGSPTITFEPVENVSMLTLDYQPKTGLIQAWWAKQESLFFSDFEMQFGFYETGGTIPDWNDPSLDIIRTKDNQYTFDANYIDTDILGNKTFVLYVKARDNQGVYYPVADSFTSAVNMETFDIVALPEVTFDEIIESTYVDNTGNILTDILLKFYLDANDWVVNGRLLKNALRNFKFGVRLSDSPLAIGSITEVVDTITIKDDLHFGEIPDGVETTDFAYDGTDPKFTGMILRINGTEARILSQFHNYFTIDRPISVNIGDEFAILKPFTNLSTSLPDTDTRTTDQDQNTRYTYKIPVQEQGNLFRGKNNLEFRIATINTFGIESTGNTSSIQLVGKPNTINPPQSATVREIESGVRFEIEPPHDADFKNFVIRAVYLDPDDPNIVDDVNKSFVLETTKQDESFLSSRVDKNGSWIFYIFSRDLQDKYSLGFVKLTLDVSHQPTKDIISTYDLLTENTNGYQQFDGTFQGIDGNIYIVPKVKTVTWEIIAIGTGTVTLKNSALLDIDGTVVNYFDVTSLENQVALTVDGDLITTGSVIDPINYSGTPDSTSFVIEVDSTDALSLGEVIRFDLENTMGVNWYSNGLPSDLEIPFYPNGQNPDWKFDSRYQLNEEINLAGGMPPFTVASFRSDVIFIDDQGYTLFPEMINQMFTVNPDEYEDTIRFSIWMRTGTDLSQFDLENYASNPFKPAKKIRFESPVYVQYIVFFSPLTADTSGSIQKLSLVVDREERYITIGNNSEGFYEITEAGKEFGYSIYDTGFNRIVDYSQLTVIDDTILDVKRCWIDVQTINNGAKPITTFKIYILDSTGAKSSGKFTGRIKIR